MEFFIGLLNQHLDDWRAGYITVTVKSLPSLKTEAVNLFPKVGDEVTITNENDEEITWLVKAITPDTLVLVNADGVEQGSSCKVLICIKVTKLRE